MIPVIIIFFSAQQYFVKGIVMTGIAVVTLEDDISAAAFVAPALNLFTIIRKWRKARVLSITSQGLNRFDSYLRFQGLLNFRWDN